MDVRCAEWSPCRRAPAFDADSRLSAEFTALVSPDKPPGRSLSALLDAIAEEAARMRGLLDNHGRSIRELRLRPSRPSDANMTFNQQVRDMLDDVARFGSQVGRSNIIRHWLCAAELK